MRSKSKTVRYPLPIDERMSIRAKEAGYDSVSEWLVGLARYDMAIRRPHVFTAELSRLPRSEQDRVDDEIARSYDSGESMGGVWLEHKIEESIKKYAEGLDPEEGKIMKRVLDKISKGRNV